MPSTLEVADVVARAESKGLLTEARSSEFIGLLEALAVDVDSDTARYAFENTLQLARRSSLSAYDAAYLELALRKGLPLATLDANLQRAAEKNGCGAAVALGFDAGACCGQSRRAAVLSRSLDGPCGRVIGHQCRLPIGRPHPHNQRIRRIYVIPG